MTSTAKNYMRSSEELFAEAEVEEKAKPSKEPWVLKLTNGTRVVFRHPDDAPVFDPQAGFRGQISNLIADGPQRRQFWEEWGEQPSRRLVRLLNAVVDYYTAEDGEGGKADSAT